MAHAISYPPLNVPKPVADGVWIVDAPPLHAGGIPLPIRMTILRLAGGELLLHSPIPYEPGLRHALEGLGHIGHLVAPSVGHWLHLRDWQAACPDAVTWAVPGLKDRGQVRRSGVRIDVELGDRMPRSRGDEPLGDEPWGDAIETVLVAGPVFREVALFHRPSRTLILTDLVINLEADLLPLPARALARLLGIVAPDGKAPLYLRLLLRLNRPETAEAARRLVAFAPERVIFSHGQWFEHDAAGELRRALAWLIGPDGDRGRQGASVSGPTRILPRASTTMASLALVGVIAALAYARKQQ